MFRRHLPVRRAGADRYRISFEPNERGVIRDFLGQLRSLLDADVSSETATSGAEQADGRIRRLFPPAYLHDAEQQAEYHRFMHGELMTSRRADLDLVEATIDATEVDEAGLMAWLRATNSVRLVLGTILDVQEDDVLGDVDENDPRLQGLLVYDFLGWVVGIIVEAMSD